MGRVRECARTAKEEDQFQLLVLISRPAAESVAEAVDSATGRFSTLHHTTVTPVPSRGMVPIRSKGNII